MGTQGSGDNRHQSILVEFDEAQVIVIVATARDVAGVCHKPALEGFRRCENVSDGGMWRVSGHNPTSVSVWGRCAHKDMHGEASAAVSVANSSTSCDLHVRGLASDVVRWCL